MLPLHQATQGDAQGDVPCHCILSLSAGLTSLVSSAVLTWSVLNVFYRTGVLGPHADGAMERGTGNTPSV